SAAGPSGRAEARLSMSRATDDRAMANSASRMIVGPRRRRIMTGTLAAPGTGRPGPARHWVRTGRRGCGPRPTRRPAAATGRCGRRPRGRSGRGWSTRRRPTGRPRRRAWRPSARSGAGWAGRRRGRTAGTWRPSSSTGRRRRQGPGSQPHPLRLLFGVPDVGVELEVEPVLVVEPVVPAAVVVGLVLLRLAGEGPVAVGVPAVAVAVDPPVALLGDQIEVGGQQGPGPLEGGVLVGAGDADEPAGEPVLDV